uniref:Putative single-stranded DNA binding protein n=1 Tax=Gelidium vagum TaxID=35171 RepID=A0A141SDZ7_GELVA|nr:putative single-stranded DNA binding protein [Gelidium vagum]AMK96515.1 putative single-stranded DNA binding protein [Gelidium vagum]
MNYSVFMCQVVSQQRYIKIYDKYYVYIKLIIPNNKKTLQYYKVIALAQGEKAKDLIELYRSGDNVVIEAAISLKKQKNLFNGRINKFILFNIYDIHPTNNILNNFV